ncbi:hypothetical protein C8J55DRAFT_487992 [Lentinula edodes]|uniref:Uncharacterized protein n=1 Tax=Lentinula lateritia TaxID=40482 RepID=A0A9W9AKT6_9AGAR|nr:hypothetical protein C8J55DRAFT_487992 [Lentinula edodes]
MKFSISEPFMQILTQDIPIISSPLFWALLSFFTAVIILRTCFPHAIVTLNGLQHRIDAVLKVITEYRDVGLAANDGISGFIDDRSSSRRQAALEFEKCLRRIKRDAYTIFLEDHNTPWTQYLSLRRVRMICSSSKKLHTLEKEIKYAQAVYSDFRNSRALELIIRIYPDTTSVGELEV